MTTSIQPVAHNLFLFTDTCNVYILQDGDSALLIDFGSGGVLEALPELGITRVEWVLFTHHHREQCQGAALLAGTGARIAGPQAERDFFENPLAYRKLQPQLEDPFTCYGSSYLRPPRDPISIDLAFSDKDDFQWRDHEFWVLATPGNSPGSLTYLLRRRDEWLAFTGDLVLDDARMHTWFDTEWDYGYGSGLYALYTSVFTVERFNPKIIFPSHGPVIWKPGQQLPVYRQKLKNLVSLYLRGWDMAYHVEDADTLSQPTAVPHLWQITPHLYKFTGAGFGSNFHMLLSGSGHALFIDCGCWDTSWLDKRIAQMRERLGLKQIDAIIVTHMHGDHILECQHLRQQHGAEIWTLDLIAETFEHPERFDYTCPVTAYGHRNAVRIDRVFRPQHSPEGLRSQMAQANHPDHQSQDLESNAPHPEYAGSNSHSASDNSQPNISESLDWQGYHLTFDWLPGQTEFALVVYGEIDGRTVALTGDNIFPSRTGSGHDAVVARNSGILEEGYLYCAEFLAGLQPDLILGGHSTVIENPGPQIERFRAWAYALRQAYLALSPDEDYEYFFDPFWVRAYPYRLQIPVGGEAQFQVIVRSHRDFVEAHQIRIKLPEDWTSEPSVLAGEIQPRQRRHHQVLLHVPNSAQPGIYMLTFDISLDNHRYGEWFDMIVEVTAEGSTSPLPSLTH